MADHKLNGSHETTFHQDCQLRLISEGTPDAHGECDDRWAFYIGGQLGIIDVHVIHDDGKVWNGYEMEHNGEDMTTAQYNAILDTLETEYTS